MAGLAVAPNGVVGHHGDSERLQPCLGVPANRDCIEMAVFQGLDRGEHVTALFATADQPRFTAKKVSEYCAAIHNAKLALELGSFASAKEEQHAEVGIWRRPEGFAALATMRALLSY
jgi:hypothetical protein